MNFTMPSDTELDGLIAAGDVDKLLSLYELAEEERDKKADELDSLNITFNKVELAHKEGVVILRGELRDLRRQASRLENAKFAAYRRLKAQPR
jgi:polyhydroxyalkanoate synthesis regulator phasin